MSLFVVSAVVSVVSVAYSYYNQQQAKSAQKKARREAERRADLAKGFQFVEEGSAKSLPIVYGRSKIGGIRVHFKVTDAYFYEPPATSGLSFESKKQPDNVPALAYVLTNSIPDWSGTWSLSPSSKEAFNANPGWILTKDDQAKWKSPDRGFVGNSVAYTPPAVDFIYCPFKAGFPNEKPVVALYELGFTFPERPGTVLVMNKYIYGGKKDFYFVQQALAYGGISSVYTIDVDQKPYSYSGYSYGMRVHVYRDGGVPDPLMSGNDSSRVGSQFYNTAYATAAFRLDRDDPQYSGTPELQFYVEGMRVRPIIKSGSTYTLSEEKAYSNNPALVLIDYLTSETHGKALPVAAIDLESFYKASKICSIILKANVPNKGSLALTKGGQRDISLYECNIALDSASSFRDNIQKILDTMGLATLVWSEGKYKLNLPYASLFSSDKFFDIDSIVQITDNGNNRLFRAVTASLNRYPLTYPSYWVEDVIPDDLKLLSDDDLLLGSELLISWPNADSKLNFATVRFLNEEQNFVEDTISWPEKEPTNSNDQVYETFLSEDNNVALEAEVFEAGCTTPYHAKALAEQRVRASRETVTYTFNAIARAFVLEPGDLFGFQSNMFNIPYSILKVEDVETEAGGIVKITASTFDANLLAANVPDEFYSPLRNSFEGYSLKQATDLEISVGQSNDKTSNYTLTWTKANDNRVSQYLISYTTDTLENITTATKWNELGTTSDDTFELPALNGDFTFTVVSLAANRRRAPFLNIAEGSSWPLLSYTLSSNFLDGFSAIDVVLSNNSHNLFASSTGVVNTYAGSGTTIQCFVGSEPLVHNQLSVSNGTFKVEVLAGDAVNISPGNIELYSNDPTVAVIQDHSAMVANTAKIVYTVSGKTKSGSSFAIYKQQSFTKSLTGTDAVYLYIEKSSAVLTKLASSAAATGAYSTATVVGKRVVGNTVSDWGYITVTPNNGTEPILATQGVVTIAPATTAGSSKYTIRLYSDANKTTLLDTEEIPVVFKGDQGIQGVQGIQGIQGPVGADGVTYYTWVKYADSPTTGMSDYPDGKLYLGIAYNKTTAVESSVYADYTWSLIKGDQGVTGPAGADGQTTYTWIKYADTATGTGMSDNPVGKTYIGIAPNKLTAVESTVATDYNWSLIQGPQGAQGPQGPSLLVNPNRALVFTATNGVLDITQADIVFTATVSGVASPTYFWSFSGFENMPVNSGVATQTITKAQFGTAKSATVTCTVSGLYSVVSTILRFELNTTDPSKAEGALQRAGDSITGPVTFATDGGILAATDADNGVFLGPNGLVGKRAGVTTFIVDTQGQMAIASGTSGARMEMQPNVIKVFDAGGNLRVKIGDLSA